MVKKTNTRKKTITKPQRKVCCNCSELINLKKDHHVQVHTLNRYVNPDDHSYFHFQCWVDYFNSRVDQKVKSMQNVQQENPMAVADAQMIQTLLQSAVGSQILGKLFNAPVTYDLVKEDKVVPKQEVISKIKDDRKRKRSGKKRKTQMHKV